MVINICRGLGVVNVIIGLYLIVTSLGTGSTPGVEKSLGSVMFNLIWAMLFFVGTFGLFFMLQWVRRYIMWLYGGCAVVTALVFLITVLEKDPLYVAIPGAVFSVYLLLFAFFLAPVFFMFHRDVRGVFEQILEDRRKQEEESGRATFKKQ